MERAASRLFSVIATWCGMCDAVVRPAELVAGVFVPNDVMPVVVVNGPRDESWVCVPLSWWRDTTSWPSASVPCVTYPRFTNWASRSKKGTSPSCAGWGGLELFWSTTAF